MHIDTRPSWRVHVQMRTYRQMVVEYLRAAETHADKKISALAKDAHIAHTTFTRFLANGEYKYVPKIDKLLKIAQVSGLPLFPEIIAAKADATPRIPVISWVAAGTLADATTQVPESDEELALELPAAGRFFATRVRGDSMDRIAPDGALLVVNQTDHTLVHGYRYIFSLRGETTFKRWGADPPRLVPESLNPSHDIHIIKKDEPWSVIGRVRRVIIEV